MNRSATFSACRRYRYALWRRWDDSKAPLVVIGLNPSTADEDTNDPTIERCQRRAQQMGLGGLVRRYWSTRAKGSCCVAGGNDGEQQGRGWAVRLFLRREGRALHALKINASGHPQHPLYVAYARKPERWL
jgi:hypothetical protein